MSDVTEVCRIVDLKDLDDTELERQAYTVQEFGSLIPKPAYSKYETYKSATNATDLLKVA